MGEKFTTQRATKVATGGFPVAVGCLRAIELTCNFSRNSRPRTFGHPERPTATDFPAWWQCGSALGERPCTAVSGKRTMNTVLPLVWTYNRDCRYPTFDEMVLNIMPLLKNGDTPEHQTILNVLETIAERYLHDRWRLRKSCQNLLNL